ncbi:TetR/AcrR family transcriptional regulator [Brevibacterium aurantiacum]|uniref:TetR/AcrR family transcriptional regulator n=1 Tax=Brevibacterium aurantiacum TaxID=273384 RepID=A0A556CIX3_BREAU|nr:TetR/AcrR family transcriptional regulator [Brevibacterium aurantiacum]TSI17028.1 TetR/AcrR family transcriptional regulator [Brevibacterium aurantiacum]
MTDRASADSPPTTSTKLWRGTSRADRDGARRQRLLEAALELYGTLGFRATSIQALCHESGVSSRSFYELFPSRGAKSGLEALSAQEALLEQLYVILNEEITEALATLTFPAHATLLDTTVHVVSAALMPMLSDERKARVLEIETVGVNDSLEARRRETMRTIATAVDAAVAHLRSVYDLPIRDTPSVAGGADLTSLILVGGITEALVQRVHTPVEERTSTAEFLTHIAEVALRAHGVSATSGA